MTTIQEIECVEVRSRPWLGEASEKVYRVSEPKEYAKDIIQPFAVHNDEVAALAAANFELRIEFERAAAMDKTTFDEVGFVRRVSAVKVVKLQGAE